LGVALATCQCWFIEMGTHSWKSQLLGCKTEIRSGVRTNLFKTAVGCITCTFSLLVHLFWASPKIWEVHSEHVIGYPGTVWQK